RAVGADALDAPADLGLHRLEALEGNRREPAIIGHVKRAVRAEAHPVGRPLQGADLARLAVAEAAQLLMQEVDEGDRPVRQGHRALGKAEPPQMNLYLPHRPSSLMTPRMARSSPRCAPGRYRCPAREFPPGRSGRRPRGPP